MAGMLAVIGWALYAILHNRHHGPTAVDKLRRLVDDMAADMSARMDGYDKRQARDRQEMDRLHGELIRWRDYSREQADYSKRLVALLREMGYAGEIPPAPVPPTAAQADDVLASNVGNDRILAIELARIFNIEELRDLEFQMGMPDGTLGEATLAARARELVRWCRRRERVEELRTMAAALRPEGKIQ